MRATLDIDPLRVLRRTVVLATRAPSLRNTQPWQFVLRDSVLELHADRSRELPRLDPVRRHLYASCGCALLNARVALAAQGVTVDVDRVPDPSRPDLVATLTLGSETSDGAEFPLAGLVDAVAERRTARHGFLGGPDRPLYLPKTDDVLISSLGDAGARGARAALDTALRALTTDPSARAELRSAPAPDRHRGPSDQAAVVLLSTPDDSILAWVRAGETFERLALELTSHRLSTVPHSQVIENPATRAELAALTGANVLPQLMVEIGRPAPTPLTRRRRLVDVLIQGV